MPRLLLPALIFLVATTIQAQIPLAEPPRIAQLARQVQQNLNNLAGLHAKDFFARTKNNRDQTGNLLVLQQAIVTARVLVILINNNRPNAELRQAAEVLSERFDRFDAEKPLRPQTQQIKKEIDQLINELKDGDKKPDDKPSENDEALGRLHWQGTVDDEVHLIIRGNVVQTKTVSGKEYDDALYNFTSPLPEGNVQVFVKKRDGRGTAKLIQQPAAGNNWTAIVQILDKSGAAREYDLEIYWTKK